MSPVNCQNLCCGADVLEDYIVDLSPLLMNALLKDHTTSTPEQQQNIFWATDDYAELGAAYSYHSPILTELITGEKGNVIMPRVLKANTKQKERSREMAEVFTPSWVCNHQNNLIDREWFGRDGVFNTANADGSWQTNTEKITFPKGKTWKDYVRDKRLEITCGEAPYMVSRYDSTTGQEIPIHDRIGLLDRKLRVVSENAEKSTEWLKWAQKAYQSVYGYEWQGDNLLIARENLLMTFVDYYRAKFGKSPVLRSLQYIAYIISWNFWQMDGLKGVVPMSCKEKKTIDLFNNPEITPCPGCKDDNLAEHTGLYCKVRTWRKKEKIRFIDILSN